MQVGVISDVHANKVALDAVLADMPPVDALVCAGDVVGYNPWPGECVDELRERDVPTVMGNHDRAVIERAMPGFNSMARAGVEFAQETLDSADLSWLESLPTTHRLFDGRIKIAHGHPDHPNRYTYPRDFAPALLDLEDVLILGHTHVQGHEQFEEGIVMNPGSVGQPRDNDPRAAYALLDTEDLRVTECRVSYDIDRVIDGVQSADLPERIGSRLRDGR